MGQAPGWVPEECQCPLLELYPCLWRLDSCIGEHHMSHSGGPLPVPVLRRRMVPHHCRALRPTSPKLLECGHSQVLLQACPGGVHLHVDVQQAHQPSVQAGVTGEAACGLFTHRTTTSQPSVATTSSRAVVSCIARPRW